jgi:hypothetical protein
VYPLRIALESFLIAGRLRAGNHRRFRRVYGARLPFRELSLAQVAEDSCSGMRRDAVLVQSNQTRGEPPLVREESDKCEIMAASGEDVA